GALQGRVASQYRAGLAHRGHDPALLPPHRRGSDARDRGHQGQPEMSWRVPLAKLEIPETDVQAVLDCLRSGWLTMGPRTNDFEQQFAAYVGSPHAVAVNSCTAALHLSCSAAGLGPGDEAIVAGMTFVSTP